MRSSDEEEETQKHNNGRLSVQFDVNSLSLDRSPVRKVLDRVDLPVQIVRLVLLTLILWVWQSERIFDGVSLLGFEIFPEIPALFRGTPSGVWDYLTKIWDDSVFWAAVQAPSIEALLGFVYGSSGGLVVGLLLGRCRRLARVFAPFLIITNAAPKVAFAPILILWYGVDIGSKIALATIIVFFIVQIPVQAAVGGIDPDLDTVASSLGASQLQKFRLVVLPGILGPLFGALRLGSIYAILAAVFGEFIASKRGLGQRLISASNQFNFGAAFALILILALLALLFNFVMGVLERRFLRWQDDGGKGSVISL